MRFLKIPLISNLLTFFANSVYAVGRTATKHHGTLFSINRHVLVCSLTYFKAE